MVGEIGDRFREAQVLDHLADSHEAAGDAAAAGEARRRAEEIRRDIR